MSEEYLELLKKQNKLLKAICLMLVIVTVAVTGSVAVIAPKVITVLNETGTAVVQMNEIATELEEADLPGLVKNSNDAVVMAMEKIDSMDVEKLNEAIAELETVVRPLAKLMGK